MVQAWTPAFKYFVCLIKSTNLKDATIIMQAGTLAIECHILTCESCSCIKFSSKKTPSLTTAAAMQRIWGWIFPLTAYATTYLKITSISARSIYSYGVQFMMHSEKWIYQELQSSMLASLCFPPIPHIFFKAALNDLLKCASPLSWSVMPSVVNVKAFVKMWRAVTQ